VSAGGRERDGDGGEQLDESGLMGRSVGGGGYIKDHTVPCRAGEGDGDAVRDFGESSPQYGVEGRGGG
jgi:hypothetical protein